MHPLGTFFNLFCFIFGVKSSAHHLAKNERHSDSDQTHNEKKMDRKRQEIRLRSIMKKKLRKKNSSWLTITMLILFIEKFSFNNHVFRFSLESFEPLLFAKII